LWRRRIWTHDVAWIKEPGEVKADGMGDKQRHDIGGAKDHLY
jgi:hypothetical protein